MDDKNKLRWTGKTWGERKRGNKFIQILVDLLELIWTCLICIVEVVISLLAILLVYAVPIFIAVVLAAFVLKMVG